GRVVEDGGPIGQQDGQRAVCGQKCDASLDADRRRRLGRAAGGRTRRRTRRAPAGGGGGGGGGRAPARGHDRQDDRSRGTSRPPHRTTIRARRSRGSAACGRSVTEELSTSSRTVWSWLARRATFGGQRRRGRRRDA